MQQNFAERAGKAHREPHRRSQRQRSENEARAIHKKGSELDSDHFQSRKKGGNEM